MTLSMASDWYSDWQNNEHVRHFDFRSALDDRNLLINYECFNDVNLLRERLSGDRRPRVLVEVGCATAEFHRYLGLRFPEVNYYGVDISQPALDRARQKYPQGRFFLTTPETKVAELPARLGLSSPPDIVYSKDVVHHQTRPLEFLKQLLDAASESVILRLRTRDKGPTETNPDLSCQYHYGGWMPYIVSNLDEIISFVRGAVPQGEIVVRRNRMILGGLHNRFLPKECYLPETGTAETALGVFKRTDHPGRVTVEDRAEKSPRYTMTHLLKKSLSRAASLAR